MKKQAMGTVRVDLARLNIKTRPVKVKLENIRVRTRPVRVKVRNQGIALKGVRVLLRKQRVQMMGTVVGRVGNIGKPALVSVEEQPLVANEEEQLEDLNDLTLDLSLRREIPTWAKTVNFMAESKKQEETGPENLFNIFAPVNLDDFNLEEDEIFKIPAKTAKRPRNFSLELDLSNFEFEPEA